MYVCICNQVTENEIRDAVRAGYRDFDLVREALGVSSCCGRCKCVVGDLIDSALHEGRGDQGAARKLVRQVA